MPRFISPAKNEWYKAAYYNGGTSTYSLYPNGQNTITTADANYGMSVGDMTDVGSYSGAPSSYGTFDQGGNVLEWNYSFYEGDQAWMFGGDFTDNIIGLSSEARIGTISSSEFSVGFRVASVPEPSCVVLTILASGLLVTRRKR